MRILVTGASGMIGSFVSQKLLRQGYMVVGIDRAEAVLDDENYVHEIVDLDDISAIKDVYDKYEIDRTIHFAALAHTAGENDLSWSRYYKINVECAENVFRVACENQSPILQISTVDVYGFTKGVVNATTSIQPVTNYGKSKALAEEKLKEICEEYGNCYSIYRFSPVYTPEIKRDIQKRYYLKYPNIAYLIGDGTEYEVLDINNAAKAILGWLDSEPGNEVKIIKDPVRKNTKEYLSREVKEGRAKIVLWFPKWLVKLGYTVIHGVLGDNSKTFLLNKAVYPLISNDSVQADNFKGKHILILEGYARQCLPFMESFKKMGCEISLLCGSKLDLGYWSKYPDHKIVGICDSDRYEESKEYICELIKKGHYDLVLPLVDFSAKILSENKEELSKFSNIASNDKDVFEVAQDKLSVMRICLEHGIPCPVTITNINNPEDVKRLRFPIVVKPRNGCGAKGFHRFDSYKEFEIFSKTAELNNWVIQEYIKQTNRNLSVSLFIDNAGVVKSHYTYISRRWFPLNGGTGTFNELVERPDAVEICQKLASVIGLKGNVGFDLIDDPEDGIPKVIEINPRILACEKIGFLAGVDRARMTLQKEFGENVKKQYTKQKQIFIRMTQTDVLWFLKSPDRFRVNPSWFQVKNTYDQTFSWNDPLPWIAFLFRGIIKLDNELKKRGGN